MNETISHNQLLLRLAGQVAKSFDSAGDFAVVAHEVFGESQLEPSPEIFETLYAKALELKEAEQDAWISTVPPALRKTVMSSPATVASDDRIPPNEAAVWPPSIHDSKELAEQYFGADGPYKRQADLFGTVLNYIASAYTKKSLIEMREKLDVTLLIGAACSRLWDDRYDGVIAAEQLRQERTPGYRTDLSVVVNDVGEKLAFLPEVLRKQKIQPNPFAS